MYSVRIFANLRLLMRRFSAIFVCGGVAAEQHNIDEKEPQVIPVGTSQQSP